MKLDFEKYADKLAPAIVQDSVTDKVLMLGFMNEEALARTIETNRVTFFSRSRQTLWTKGETSGNSLKVVRILADCDNDTLLIKAEPAGPVCHTGADTCFDEPNRKDDVLSELEALIRDRKRNPKPEAYTSKLFARGMNKIAQKVGEEAVELVIEAKDDNRELFLNESADLLFHMLVLFAAKDVTVDDVLEVLRSRRLA
ncbi:MAG: bifunctional phosphoribosyl-AMP cyclohydrolase/phosphoribosyl-ATP diphosphatase HisIE [Acidobacteria bacterium]|nr:bifunctional phosphoribosyl-AMP cyclohydrolase/phosphoribosyl-ATP diphosphatase HisIE [Acidobacteriota bacterium]